MLPATLQLFVQRDLITSQGFWNGNYFGKKIFNLLGSEAQKLGAVAITHNRCEMDKLTWKVVLARDPPSGFETWREYARQGRLQGM